MRVPVACLALAFSGMGAAIGTCYAETITFEVSGSLFNKTTGFPCTGCTLGGTIGIDPLTGHVSDIDVTADGTGTGPFTSLEDIGIENPPYAGVEFYLSDAAGDALDLGLPNIYTLIGYDGGPLCLNTSPTLSCGGQYTAIYGLEDSYLALSGDLTPEVSVPGPVTGSGLPALILGACGLLAWWRTRRKSAKSHSVCAGLHKSTLD
jgi:hypothetical protein